MRVLQIGKLVFHETDFDTDLWKRLHALFEERLTTLRMKNDGRLDEYETARLRGRISELKYVLALPKMVAPAGADDD